MDSQGKHELTKTNLYSGRQMKFKKKKQNQNTVTKQANLGQEHRQGMQTERQAKNTGMQHQLTKDGKS